MVRKLARWPEADFEDWLDQGTYDDWLYLARAARKRLCRAIEEADARGDGPLVNALCQACREVFAANMIW
jgi:hypothetical protein